jgi:predicted  nucleic acid-binding Zn-ribbon protein
MDAQLEILLQIQDLKGQRRDLEEGGLQRQMEEEAFDLKVDEALAMLDEKIAEVVDELDPRVRKRYHRLAGGRVERVVVPAIKGTCYGCFVSVPVSVSSDPSERAKLRNCESCGRFLYFID